MGKLFKIDLGEEDELFLGYHQKKLYQHFRTCCKNKLKQLKKYQKKLNRKYFENNRQNGTNTMLNNELDNELNYYYELNKYAINLLNNNDTCLIDNNDIKSEDNDNNNNNNNNNNDNNMIVDENDIINIDIKNFNYNDYKSVLSDIAYNDNTPNYKIFKKIFEDKERNKKQLLLIESNEQSIDDNININNYNINNCDGSDIYCCIRCGMHLTKKSLVMDENFHGRTGPSFLIQSVFNIDIGPKATRKLHTGMHVVSDIFCKRCSTNVGWYYHEASKLEQQYKISHYVLECCLICTKKQYIIHNYYYSNNLLPNLNYSINNNNIQDQDQDQEEDDDDDDDDASDDNDDTMNDLTQNLPLLPSYMSYSHPSYSYNYKTIKNKKYKQKIKNENLLIPKFIQQQQQQQNNTDNDDDDDDDDDDEDDDDDDDNDDDEEKDQESISTESEQIGSATDSESDDETAERISSIDNDNIDEEDETEEVDID